LKRPTILYEKPPRVGFSTYLTSAASISHTGHDLARPLRWTLPLSQALPSVSRNFSSSRNSPFQVCIPPSLHGHVSDIYNSFLSINNYVTLRKLLPGWPTRELSRHAILTPPKQWLQPGVPQSRSARQEDPSRYTKGFPTQQQFRQDAIYTSLSAV
jgi:hypothetical protein